MTPNTRSYPDEPAGPFPTPPITCTDREGRDILVREYEDDDHESLVAMYVDFDPADRAQGIPPVGEERIEDWTGHLLDGINVVALHDGDVVGHATLVEDHDGSYELAIFVHQDYQQAGIGTRLIKGLLGLGEECGVDRVWLSVERWNRAAISLYEKVGFRTAGAESFELEMALRLH